MSELTIGDAIAVGDIAAPEGVTIVTDPETVVASVVAPSSDVGEETADEVETETTDAGGGDSSS